MVKGGDFRVKNKRGRGLRYESPLPLEIVPNENGFDDKFYQSRMF